MARRLSVLAVAVAFIGLSLPSTAQAQWTFYVAGGATFPTGDFGNYANTGWMGIAGALFDIQDGISLGVEGFYGQNNHEENLLTTSRIADPANFAVVGSSAAADKTNPYGFMGTLTYMFGMDGSVKPYVFGGAGILWHKYTADTTIGDLNATDSGFAYEFGGGVAFGLSPSTSLFAEGRYMAGTGDADTKMWGIFGGFAFGL